MASATRRFQQRSHGISLELTLLVALDDPVKLCRLSVRNESLRERSLSVTAYLEWVLGLPARLGAPHVITERDPETGVLLARNPWNHAFPGVAFIDLGGRAAANGPATGASSSAGMDHSMHPRRWSSARRLSGRTGAALDPCAALRSRFELAPGAEHRVHRVDWRGGECGRGARAGRRA